MRLTSWNGSPGADPTRCLTLLDPLRPDVVTLQECRRPSRLDRTVVWHGPTKKQGVAVARRTSDLRVEPLTIPGLHPTVLPVLVSGPSPFLLVGVWTLPPYHPVAYAAMKACVGVAARLPLVAAGDFNSSPRVSGQARTSPEFMKRMREEFGLVNAYHSHFDEALGEETRPTYYDAPDLASAPLRCRSILRRSRWPDGSVGRYIPDGGPDLATAVRTGKRFHDLDR